MMDLASAAEPIANHFKQSLEAFASRNGPAQSIFYHTQPNFGQNHLYFSLNASDGPDEILGRPIDEVIDIPEWEEELELARSAGYERRIKLPDGTVVDVPDWNEWNRIIASFCNDLIKSTMKTLDKTLLPKRVYVGAEEGQFDDDWRPEDL
jgi:hypothetical protein